MAFESSVLLLLSLGCEPSVEDRQRTARELVGEERFEEAWTQLEGIDPLNADGYLALGVLRAEQDDDEAALDAFTAGLQLEPLPELYVNDCIVRLRLERGALDACKRAVLEAPTDPRSSVGLAEAAARDGTQEAAKEALFTASDLVGDDLDTMAWMAEVWAAVDEQTAACTWGVRSQVDSVVVGRACLHAGRGPEAVAMLERLADAESCGLLFTLSLDEAERHAEGPQRQKALGRAERWQRCNTARDVTWFTDLGRLQVLQGDRLAAEASWREGMALDPQAVPPRLNLARSLLDRDQSDGRVLLEGWADFHTADGLVFSLELAAWDRREGDLAGAASRASRVADGCQFVGSLPCLAEARYEQGRLLTLQGRHADALEHLRLAVEAGGDGLRRRIANEPDLSPLREELAYYDLVNSGP